MFGFRGRQPNEHRHMSNERERESTTGEHREEHPPTVGALIKSTVRIFKAESLLQLRVCLRGQKFFAVFSRIKIGLQGQICPSTIAWVRLL